MRGQSEENFNKPFEVRVVEFGGDFKQIFPMVTKGSRVDIIKAIVSSSPIWKSCKILKLT